ncbi:MAG: hypothetical protein ACI94Y_004621, partial [Maribacter sp.]
RPGDNHAHLLENYFAYVIRQQENPLWNELHRHYFEKTSRYTKTDKLLFQAFYKSSLPSLAKFKDK